MPLCYIGGLVSREKIDEVLDEGFEFVAMARAVLNDPEFVNKMREDEHYRVACDHSNYCIGRMYSKEMACHKCILREGKETIPQALLDELEANRKKGY
jgi:2,4-dienoyl-CoA reductase-like NADH-dependent reductase (Old Yellow Enzyme family)